eukprot:scaffold160870_cov73-Attheya_sp.AAC.3
MHHTRASEAVEEERVSCVYRRMHDRRVYQRGAFVVEIKGGCEGGDTSRGGGGGGDFLARILVYKGEEG